jgi:hypothetical protein
MAIDFSDEHLKGCPTCNIWRTPNDTNKRLPEADLRALYDMMHHTHRDD